jgi:opacity protein-like surface antigen
MKKILTISMGALLLAASLNASAWWGNDGWGRGYNDWPVFTPMYWMEEMADSWDDDYYDGYYGGPYGGYGPGYGYGAPYGGGYAPAYPAAPAPAPAPVQ